MLFLPADQPVPGPTLTGAGPLPDQGALFDAVRDQLGLKLEPTRVAIDMVVITSIVRPMPN